MIDQGLDGFVAAETVHNLHTLHLTSCLGDRPVVLNVSTTARTDSVTVEVIFHQERQTGRGEAILQTGGVSIDTTDSIAVQVAEGSSSRDPTLRVVLQLEFFRFVLSSCWSGGRLSLIVEIVNHESSADHSSGDGEGVGQYSGDRPGYDEI